jgi:predicted nucleic acid-binding protein
VGLAELDHALGKAGSVLLASSTLLAFYNRHELVHPLARHLLGRIEHKQDPLQGWYSAVSVMDLLVRPMVVGQHVAEAMMASLTQLANLHFVPVDAEVAKKAAEVRSKEKISPADALVVASGLVASCDAIISNDDRWKKRLAAHYPVVQFIYLDAFVEGPQDLPIDVRLLAADGDHAIAAGAGECRAAGSHGGDVEWDWRGRGCE